MVAGSIPHQPYGDHLRDRPFEHTHPTISSAITTESSDRTVLRHLPAEVSPARSQAPHPDEAI